MNPLGTDWFLLVAVSEEEPATDKVLLFWSPEVCINFAPADDDLHRHITGTTYVSTLSD
jgi:hypothetical protein